MGQNHLEGCSQVQQRSDFRAFVLDRHPEYVPQDVHERKLHIAIFLGRELNPMAGLHRRPWLGLQVPS